MAHRVYCRWETCDGIAEAIAGKLPSICLKCGREALWMTDPNGPRERRKHAKGARVKFDLTALDRKLLQRLRIASS